MLALLLLPLLWGGSLQEKPGYELQVQESVTVQEGLCVLVPCSFSYPGNSWYSPSPLYVYWFRDEESLYYGEPVATNNPDREVKSETQGRFHLLGDVWKKNCSLSIGDARMGDTGNYSFRVEKGRNVKYTYLHNKLNLEVTALTEKPDVHFLEPLESGRLTRLSCSLPGSCEAGRPLTFSWTGDALSPLDPETTGSSELTLTPRPEDHGTNLTCHVKRQGAQVTTERTVQLNVSYAPQNLAISIFFRNGTGTGSSSSCICVTEKQEGSWPLVLTLIRGALMGTGFLLTYGLTWIYYTRRQQEDGDWRRHQSPASRGPSAIHAMESNQPETVEIRNSLTVQVPFPRAEATAERTTLLSMACESLSSQDFQALGEEKPVGWGMDMSLSSRVLGFQLRSGQQEKARRIWLSSFRLEYPGAAPCWKHIPCSQGRVNVRSWLQITWVLGGL
ncbi:sialic acid-binding Ig-like lectin 14 isoform X3 [Macaca fascicularis]|uniref:sialic acid-binding Ig-like lectin 14 isoform X3 n=1 Tax=Macaca fascicularis TaxID=9541 RepID=UPI0032B06942